MSQLAKFTATVLTDGSGDATARLGPIMGFVAQVRYVPDGSAPLDTNADLDIVSADSGVVVANHDNIGTSAFTKAYAPVPVENADGTALDSPQVQYALLSGEDLIITIANGGSAKAGTFHVWAGFF